MITCILNGRMGNQMFQIAAAIGTAIKYGITYSIPQQTLNNLFPVYFTHFPDIPVSLRRIKSHHESKNEYEPINYIQGTTLKLNGYFQSYKYFEHCIPEIIKSFQLSGSLLKDYVSIHVRRGDYTELSDFSVLSIYYYYQAIDYFRKKGHENFIVFSDDMPWCRHNINSNLYSDCKFIYSEDSTPQQDMRLMSGCEHNIIANSSFSWWGAWLNKNPNKIVIAPNMWFKNSNKDLLPKEWIIFNNE